MFINTYYLHREDWLMALPHPSLPPIAPPPLTPPLHAAHIKKAKQGMHTQLSSMTTPFAKELGPLLTPQILHPKTPSLVLSLRKPKRVPTVMLKYLWSLVTP